MHVNYLNGSARVGFSITQYAQQLQLLDGHSIWNMNVWIHYTMNTVYEYEFICSMCFYVATNMSNICFIAFRFSFSSKVWFLWTLVVRTTATPFLGSSDRLRGNVRAPVRLCFLNGGTHSRFCSFLIKWNLQYSRRKLLGMRNSKHTFIGQSSNLLSYSSKMSVINMFSVSELK